MKKKGFTLVELIAVMAITSVVILSVGGLYVTGIKKAQTTKINNDIENTYRNTYQLIKNQIEDSDKVISLKVDNNTKALGKEFNVEKKSNELQGLVEDKAYILTKNNNSNIETVLATFKKGDSGELGLYILYINKDNIDENQIKENKNTLNLANILRVRDVCDNLKTIDITEAGNGFNFKLEYLKNKVQRNYEFYISKNSKMLTINNTNSTYDVPKDNTDKEKNVPKKLVEFYKGIASLTVLNPEIVSKSIQLTNASISLDGAYDEPKNSKPDSFPSFFIKDIINNDGKESISEKIEFKNGIIINKEKEKEKGFTNVKQFINAINNEKYTNNKGSIVNLRNNNGGNHNLQPLNLNFVKADKDIIITGGYAINENEISLKKIVNDLSNKDCVLIKINKENKAELEKISIKDDDKNKIYNFNDYVGAIMNIGDNKCTIIVNGDLTIKSLKQTNLIFKNHQEDKKNIAGMLIYSTGTLNIEGDTSVERTSFVVNNGINITGKLDIRGQYTLTGEKRNVISTFLNNGGN